MTQREFYNVILNGTGKVSYKNENGNTEYKDIAIDAPEVKAYAKAAIEKLNDRNEARKTKLTDKQKDNLVLRAAIAEKTEVGVQYTGAALAELVGATQAKVNYQARVLAEAGYFEKGEVKVKGKGKVNGYTRTDKVYEVEAETDAE